MKFFEKVCIVMLLIGVALKLLHIAGAGILITVSALALSAVYLIFGFAFFNNVPVKKMFKKTAYSGVSAVKIIYAIFAGWTLAIIVYGVVFGMHNWPGTEIMLLNGIFMSLLLFIVSLVAQLIKRSTQHYMILTRVVPFMLANMLLYALSLKP